MSAALVLALRGDDSIGGACEECALNGMSWTVPEHSIEDVNAAGRRLITTLRGSTIPSGEDGLAEWRKSLNVVKQLAGRPRLSTEHVPNELEAVSKTPLRESFSRSED
jgi:hypothetical protein